MKQIKIVIACLLLASSLLAINQSNYPKQDRIGSEKDELMKIFKDETTVEQFLEDMQTRESVTKKDIEPNRNLAPELIIITDDNFFSEFEEFAKIKKREGFVTDVVSTSSIGTTPSDIRDYLKTEKQSNNYLQYVILGGDESVVPPKLFPWLKNGEERIATTDFYYSNVLSTWPADEDVMDIVLEPDIYVGRIPVRNTTEISKFISKYEHYRTTHTEYSDKMQFIASNIQKMPDAGGTNSAIDFIIDHVDSDITTDALYSEELVDSINGSAKAVIDKFQDRDYSFLYGIWHGGGDCYVFHDSECFDFENEWYENTFSNHCQYLSIDNNNCDEGTCWYSYDDSLQLYNYHYSNVPDNYKLLQAEIPNYVGNTYIAWFGTCYTTDLNFQSQHTAVQRDSSGNIIENFNINGEVDSLFPYYVESVDTVFIDNNTVSEVLFNEEGGPVALNAPSCDDYPYLTKRVVSEYMDRMFLDDFHKLGYLTRESWDQISQYFDYPLIRHMYMGYTLFGDPSMDVWSSKAKQLITIVDKDEMIPDKRTFIALNNMTGLEEDALICITDSDGNIITKGDSPLSYEGTLPNNYIITSNAPNFIQCENEYSEIKCYSKIPYKIDFKDGLDHNWEMHRSNSNGLIEITEEYSPYTNKHLIMSSGGNCINDGWLHLNLEQLREVNLQFFWKDFRNNYEPDYDGIYISDDDGDNFLKVYNLNSTSGRWAEVNLDIDSLASANNLTLNDNFVIKFQIKSEDKVPNDGAAFDNIFVSSDRMSKEQNFTYESSKSNSYGLKNSPNPFNPVTTISFNMPDAYSQAKIQIYNLKGQSIKTLTTENNTEEKLSVTWNGKDDGGKAVASGIYFYKLIIGNKVVATKKMNLLK